MSLTPAELAEALSGHRFDEVIPHLAPDVEWDLVGQATLSGRDAVIEALESTTAGLAGTTTEFSRFLVVAEGTTAVVDSIATYTAPEGDRSVVASCDVYEFAGDAIVRIRSYNVELD